ncbi:MAG: SWIM zinc finger family protein [Coriobacteriales bacterium]|nr:SWIM zinc finger family protein [Coriobacteriales bacterium]
MSTRHGLDWHLAFDDGPLSRGLAYYERGLVSDLQRDQEGWHATVRGSWDYEVTVATLEDGTPDPDHANTSCSCPYFSAAGPCKHIAATCFAIEDEPTPIAKAHGDADWEALLRSITPQDREAFLHDLLSRDTQLRREFIARFGELNVADARRAIASGIDSALCRYGDGYGYIDWHNELAFELDASAAIRDVIRPYVDRGAWQAAFDVSLAALAVIRSVDAGRADGFYSTATDVCLDIWRVIVTHGGDAGSDVVAKGIPAFLAVVPGDDDVEDVLGLQQSDAFGFFVSTFQDNARHAAKVYEWCATALHTGLARFYWNGERHHAIAALHAMRTMGKSVDERVALARPYLRILKVRREMASDLLASDRADEAIALLREGLANCLSPDDLLAIHTSLLDCYEVQGDVEQTKRCLEELIHRTSSPKDAVTWWHKLRELTAECDWDEVANEVLQRVQVLDVRCALLAEQGRLDDLLTEIEKHNDADLLKDYDVLLAQDYPARVIKLYRNKVMSDLDRASSRNGYRAALLYLERMGTLPQADQAFVDTAADIRAIYPRRPALHDELSKIGG